MEQNIKVAVLGGGGRTGEYLVNQLVDKGYKVQLLLRNPENFQIKNPLIEIIRGDALDLLPSLPSNLSMILILKNRPL